MKKIYVTLLVAVISMIAPLHWANAQLAVAAPGVEAVMTATHLEQLFYWGQQVDQMLESVRLAQLQFEQLKRAEERALDNLKGVTKINSWDDFMAWYNRQLYLERETERRFNNIGVKIGGETYHIKDIADIPDALRETYVDYWDNEFTEKQRREMWYRLGLTPSNYNYIQVWKKRERDLAEKFLAKTEIQNEEYMRTMEQYNGMKLSLMEDALDPKMGEKEVLTILTEATISVGKGVADLNMTVAEMQEMQAVQTFQQLSPSDAPPLSFNWRESYYQPIP